MARDTDKLVTIPGELHSAATGSIVAAAEEIFDYTANKYQKDINQEIVKAVGYYECSTPGSTAAKTITIDSSVSLSTKILCKVKFVEKNTVNNATMNINGTGAKDLYYNGVRVAANNSWYPNEVVDLYYDGTNYQAKSCADTLEYDVSKRNPTGGPNSDGKFTLEYILNNADTLIPTSVRKGGMSINFVQSSDNKYVQYRLMNQNWSMTISDWQGVDDIPTAGSDNLVKSRGVAAVNGYYTNDELWRWVILDSQNRILLGLQSDGTLQWYVGIPAHIRQYISEQIGDLREIVKVTQEQVDNISSILSTLNDIEEHVSITIDADSKVVNFRDKTGTLHELAGIVTPQIQSPTIDALSDRIDETKSVKYDIIFASYDSSDRDKAIASYVCSATNAQEVIQNAINNWYANNEYNAGCFYFCAGTYVMTHFVEPDPESDDKYGTPYCIVLPRGKNKGTGRDHYPTFCHIEGAYDNRRPGVTFLLSRDAYLLKRDGTTEALQDFHEDSSVYQPETTIDNITYPARYLDDSKRYSVIRTVSDSEEQGYSRWCAHGIKIKNIIFKADGDENNRRLTQYPIVMIDGLYASDIDLENLQVTGNAKMLSADRGADNHNVGFTGIRCNQGQSTGTHQHIKGVLVANFYHGIEFGSEHWLIQDVAIRQNHIGIAFGCYHDTWGSGHPNVFSCMALEVNAIPMYFYYNKLFDSLNWIGGRNIYMTGVGTELNKYLSSEIKTDGCHIEHPSATPTGFINWSDASKKKHLFDGGSLKYLNDVQINNNRIPKSAYWVNLKDMVAEHGQIVYLLEEKCFVIWDNYYDKINKPMGYWEMLGTYAPNETVIEEIINELN